VPGVALASTRYQDTVKVYPGLSNQFGLLIVIEHRYFEVVIIRGVVDGEAHFLVPEVES
jgi:hypothetical protein